MRDGGTGRHYMRDMSGFEGEAPKEEKQGVGV